MTDAGNAIEMRGITVVYPNGIAANKEVDFSVKKGEIHALMGENGAGKSTLVKVLFGLESPESGEIFVEGKEVRFSSPNEAIACGIGMVHQHFMLVPSLTVAENLALGIEPKKRGIFIDYKKAAEMAGQYAARYDLFVDPGARVADIPVGMKQKVEILKALVRGARILILDEPTAVLTAQETEQLFRQLLLLKERGYTVIFISHKLREIKQMTDRITVMRAGRSVGVYRTADISEQEISRRMVGRDVVLTVEKPEARPGERVLAVKNLSFTNGWGKRTLKDVSFSVRKGEILGVAGVEGNGQRELVDLLFGLARPDGGEVKIGGEDIAGMSQGEIRRRGVAYIPEDRMAYGVAADASVEENVISDRFSGRRFNRGPLFRMAEIRRESERLTGEYRILARSGRQPVRMLSGGNIQKVVVAREFSSDPALMIADQPTRGIDVGATGFIREKMVTLSRKGAAVLLVSADLNEIMELSDSLIVMYEGEIVAYFEDTAALGDAEMGEYMLGLKRQSGEEIGRALYAR